MKKDTVWFGGFADMRAHLRGERASDPVEFEPVELIEPVAADDEPAPEPKAKVKKDEKILQAD